MKLLTDWCRFRKVSSLSMSYCVLWPFVLLKMTRINIITELIVPKLNVSIGYILLNDFFFFKMKWIYLKYICKFDEFLRNQKYLQFSVNYSHDSNITYLRVLLLITTQLAHRCADRCIVPTMNPIIWSLYVTELWFDTLLISNLITTYVLDYFFKPKNRFDNIK